MKGIFAKAAIAATVLTALAACQGADGFMGAEEGRGRGTLAISVASATARTVMPALPGGEVGFRLEFEFLADSTRNFAEDWDGTSVIELDAGDWRLRIEMFAVEGTNRTMLAESDWSDLTIAAGISTSLGVALHPVAGGNGWFCWDGVSFPPEALEVSLQVERTDGGSPAFDETLVIVGTGAVTETRIELPAGVFRAVFTLSDGNGRSAAIGMAVHVRGNFESTFADEDRIIANFVFPADLLDVVLSAWDGTVWNPDLGFGRTILAGHFALLGILGIDDANFADVVSAFNDLLSSDAPPSDLPGLKAMTDAALILLAAEDAAFTRATNLWSEASAEAAVEAVALNTAPGGAAFTWTGYSLSVTIGDYSVEVVFVPVAVESISIPAPAIREVMEGGEIEVVAEILPADARDQRVSWAIPDTDHRVFAEIVSQDQDARTATVRGLAEGDAVLVATSLGNPAQSAQVTVEVSVFRLGFTINPPDFPPPGGGIGVDLEGPTISLLDTTPTVIRVASPGLYSSIRWLFGDPPTAIGTSPATQTFVSGDDGEVLNLLPTIAGAALGVGTHIITVEVIAVSDNLPRSRRIAITVTL